MVISIPDHHIVCTFKAEICEAFFENLFKLAPDDFFDKLAQMSIDGEI